MRDMDPRLQDTLNRSRHWYDQTRLKLLDLCLKIKHGSVLLAQRLQQWFAVSWPPFRDRVIVYATRARLTLTRLAGLAQVHILRLAVTVRDVIINGGGQLSRLSSTFYNHVRRQYILYWPSVRQRLLVYAELSRLNRPIGILLLLWPTLWALWIAAQGPPSLHVLFVFVSGVVLTRSAGCVLNDMTDRNFDVHVRRTASRPLAVGKIQTTEALALACAQLLIAFVLVLTLDRLTILLSFVAIPLAVIYPFMKRYTYVPQFFLGLAFSWGIPMAFAAVTGSVPPMAWLLFAANILWSVVYDTIYAMVDREDDLKAGIKSTAILFDDADRTIIGILQLMFLTTMLLAGIQIEAKMLYYACMGVAAVLMIYHQYLIRHRLPVACFKAFLNNHWVGLSLFAGIYLNYL